MEGLMNLLNKLFLSADLKITVRELTGALTFWFGNHFCCLFLSIVLKWLFCHREESFPEGKTKAFWLGQVCIKPYHLHAFKLSREKTIPGCGAVVAGEGT